MDLLAQLGDFGDMDMRKMVDEAFNVRVALSCMYVCVAGCLCPDADVYVRTHMCLCVAL